MSTDPKNLVGVTLSGRYRVERPIGEGGMGAVFEATQLSLGRHVAIKVVKPASPVGGGSDDENLKRFERETEAIAKLAHPNIVAVVDAGKTEDGTMYLAMELLSGENVRQVLKRDRSIELSRALNIVADVASALVAAHGAGIIHRDLKAENVMLVRAAGKPEIAKVLDFGVAKLTTQTEAPAVTGSGFVAGTPGSIAPEQMVGKQDEPRSDLYSLGVMLYEMLAGEAPFRAGSTMELMLKHLTEPAPSVAVAARMRGFGEIPPPIDRLVASMLAKDPIDRPASAAALLDTLRALGDANSATLGDIPTPSLPPQRFEDIGSRVVAVPSSPSLATPGASAAPTTVVSTSPGTSPTTAMPQPPHPHRPPIWKIAIRIAATLAVFSAASVGWMKYTSWSADRPSSVPAAAADIERAIDDFWSVDLDKLDEDTTAAIALDPDAPLAYVLRAFSKGVARKPSVRIDGDLFLARKAAAKRATMMVNRTRTEGLVEVLSLAEWKQLAAAFDEHCQTFHGCTDLERQLVVDKLVLALADADVIERIIDGMSEQTRPHTLLSKARALRYENKLAESKAVLERALVEAPGRPMIVHALVDTELEMGERDAAVAALEKVAAKDDRAATRLAALRARAGDNNAFDDVIGRVRGLPRHSDERIDGLTLIGYHLASQGRFREAEALWNEAIADKPPTLLGDGRALENAAVAMLLGIVRPDRPMTDRWVKRLDEIGVAGGPGSERLAVFQRAGRALQNSLDDGDLETAKAELAKLEAMPNDVAVVGVTVRWHVAVREKNFAEAERIAKTEMDRCFSPIHLSWTALAAGKRAEAERLLDAATTDAMLSSCTTGDDIVPFVQSVMFARAIADRAWLAMEDNDVDAARAAIDRFRAFWPDCDAFETLLGGQLQSAGKASAVAIWLGGH